MKRKTKRRYEKKWEKEDIFPLRTTSGLGVGTISGLHDLEDSEMKKEETRMKRVCRMYSDVEDDNDYDDDRN